MNSSIFNFLEEIGFVWDGIRWTREGVTIADHCDHCIIVGNPDHKLYTKADIETALNIVCNKVPWDNWNEVPLDAWFMHNTSGCIYRIVGLHNDMKHVLLHDGWYDVKVLHSSFVWSLDPKSIKWNVCKKFNRLRHA